MTILVVALLCFLFGTGFGLLVSDMGQDIRFHIRARRQRAVDITNGIAVAKLLKRSVK
jgi:hypothetical protein